MGRQKDLKLWKYEISKERYRELLHFCRQYNEWKSRTNYGLTATSVDGMPHGSSISDPTVQQALKNEKYSTNINLIENTCKEADSEIWKYLLRNVTTGITYEEMQVPRGRVQFYNSRRKFFYMLDLKRP